MVPNCVYQVDFTFSGIGLPWNIDIPIVTGCFDGPPFDWGAGATARMHIRRRQTAWAAGAPDLALTTADGSLVLDPGYVRIRAAATAGLASTPPRAFEGLHDLEVTMSGVPFVLWRGRFVAYPEITR